MTSDSAVARWLDAAGRDVKYAVRTLRREPTFVAGVVLTFALAIGTNAAMVGLVTRLMLAPPPGIRGAERVAHARFRVGDDDGSSFVLSTTSYPTFRALRGVNGAFAAVAATRPDSLTIGRGPDAVLIPALAASGEYFSTLGATPALGRFFGPADDELPNGNSVVVLGNAYWQRTYAGDRAVLGREIVVDGQPFTIIGVAARGFNGDELSAVDAFVPLTRSMRGNADDWVSNRYMNLVSIVVRLREGVRAEVARQMASAALRDDAPAATGRRALDVELSPIIPGADARVSPRARIALWLAGVSIVVLLIATANVGTLLALRAARRRRELAVRLTMGASRGDLARQLLIESVLLSAIGAAVGLVFSRWFSDAVRATLLPDIAQSETFVDRRVLVVSIVVAAVAGVVAALAPLANAARADLSVQLRQGGGHGASGRLALQRTLVTVQVALSTLLLVGAALFVRSLERVQSQNLGFSTARLLYVTLDFRGYVAGVERDLAYYDALARVRALPVVTKATVVSGIPFGPHYIPPVSIPGLPWPPANVQIPIMYGATPEYLDMMGVALVSGRLLTARDGRGAPPVVLVNETMARTAWPGRSPLGACVRAGFGGGFPPSGEGNPAESAPCREVVGVVRDSRARSLRPEGNEDRLMQYYVPFEQLPESPRPDPSQVMGLMIRVRGEADHAAPVVQHAIQSTSVLRAFARTRPYQDLLDPQLRSWRLGATLFSAFGALALGIATVGLFGVVSYTVTQRTREIGVRLALGGSSETIARLVVGDAVRMVSLGIVAGVVASLAIGPLIASLLFQTSPREPASIAMAGAILLVATLVAAAWPAWRAGRVPPVVALRAD